MMSVIIFLATFCAGIYICITWLLPKLIGWFLVRKFNIKLRFGRLSLPFSLRDVNICKDGWNIQIDEINIRSSFFSEVTKLLSINIHDIRINKDVDNNDPDDQPKRHKNYELDFRNKKIPHSIITFAQFMAVHMYNLSIVLMNNNMEPGWLLHGTASELHLDGSIVHNEKTLLVSLELMETQAKVLRHVPAKKTPFGQQTAQPCMIEISFGLALDGVVMAQGPLSLEKLSVSTNNAKTILHNGLYDFILDVQNEKELKSVLSYNYQQKKEQGPLSSITYEKIAPIIPKNFMIKIEDTIIAAVRDNSSNDFLSKLHLLSISGKIEPHDPLTTTCIMPMFNAKVQILQLEIDTMHEKILYVEEFSVAGEVKNDVVNIYSNLKALQMYYNHYEVYGWIQKNFSANQLKPSKSLSLTALEKSATIEHTPSQWESIFKQIIIKGTAEFTNISGIFKLNEEIASISISHTKLSLTQEDGTIRSNTYNSNLANMLLSNRQWTVELMTESLWWSLGSITPENLNLSRKQHLRGTPFYLGWSIIKLSSYGDTTKLEASIQVMRAEYSSLLASFLLQVTQSILQYRKLRFSRVKKLKFTKTSKENPLQDLVVSIKVKEASMFLINKHNNCLMFNVDEFVTHKQKQGSAMEITGFEVGIIDLNKISSTTITSVNKDCIFMDLKCLKLEYSQNVATKSSKVVCQVIQNTSGSWNTNLHMHILSLIEEIKEFQGNLLPKKVKEESPVKENVDDPPHIFVLDFYANSNIDLFIKICETHSMQISLSNLLVSRKDRYTIQMDQILIFIDGMQILTVKGITVQSMHELKILQHERQNYETFVMPSNGVWAVCLDEFRGIFPYDFDFSDAMQSEFVTLFKWLKKVHKYQKKPFTVDSPLPKDIIIQVKEFLLEMSDDPFEVKLRENYVLLMDEYFESLKRKELFDQKLADLRKERLLLPAGMVAELNATLIKKNSEIYIQRSKKIAEAGPARTRLIGWVLTDLEVMTMADPSIHGTENVVRMMQEIDSESPWPEEGLDFVTLWCRAVSVSCTEWKFMLRDYPQPMFHVKAMHLFGYLCGAEQAPPRRARRDVEIDLGHPFGKETLQRGMTALKFYHDFDWELDYLCYAFGPCWEPVMAQCNLSFEKISAPSKDPSPPLPFWDKMRFLFHGRMTMIAKQYTILLHASLDPYNTTEEMELTWSNCGIVWTNAKVMFKGELNVSVRTASRYDDCRLLHLPNLRLTCKLNWICLANPNDHHAVIPCAPDKLPEYSSNQVHDSYRAFRSQNLNISISFETKPNMENECDIPNLVLYGSTLRWFESLKLILSGVTRPTRRGPVFNNLRPRKKQLSRHYKKCHLQMSMHTFQIYYWMSHAMNRGFQLNGGRVSLSSEHILALNPIDDGLIHRNRSDWDIVYMNCELNDAEIWLKTTLNEKNSSSSTDNLNWGGDICRDYFLSVAKVSYGRDQVVIGGDQSERNTPIHKLVVHDLKGAWTKNNRDVAFALFDSFVKAQKLKDNLGTDALKSFRKENTTPSKSRKPNDLSSSVVATPVAENVISLGGPSSSNAPSKQQTPHALAMLHKLIAEADNNYVAYSDDMSTQTREQNLKGLLGAKQSDDIIHYNWSISLVNSQVLLKGCETSGYVILSAAKAEILQKLHRPVWRDRTLVSKNSWVGTLECMQYYATVSAEENTREMSEIMWLTVDNIQEKDRDATLINEFPDLPHLVGSGQSVGGVVSECVGATGAGYSGGGGAQLQRIVSRCKCEFFYVSYGDTSIDPNAMMEVPAPPVEESMSPWEKTDEMVDAFTLMHHDLDVCTNSLQYAMILDIVNNLLLYVDPERKKALENLARMRFQLQLYSSEDQKRPIQHLQTQIRNLMSQIRTLEKDIHFITKALMEEKTEDLLRDYEEIQQKIKEYKDRLVTWGDELDMMLSCYKETQLSASNKLQAVRKDKPLTIVRTNEICFKHAQWRLTEADGQIGIADLILSNFLYTKNSKSDDSVEHLLELGYIRINNLIPQDQYDKVLCPTELQRDVPIDHLRVLRVFCREKPPVGGISVKEHFEINVVPITICISKKFYQKMLKFCFPDRDTSDGDAVDDIEENRSTGSQSSLKATKKQQIKQKKEKKDSNFYVKIEKDDVEKMKERAEKNKLFIYIKIPEVPVRVSYKGSKEKNLEDINELSLVIPTIEYHNVTWTWLDLLLSMKNDSRKVLLSQAIKQKLKLRTPLALVDEKQSPQEEDKAKMLFGNRHLVRMNSISLYK
uniref:CSON015125 protein n=1 Tax=Culicoides sonorensis TaxID=179676 RepID=A0A336L3B3_CULSO